MPGMTIKREQILFYLYYVIMLFTKGLGLTDGMVYKGCIAAASAFALLKILTEGHSRREYVWIVALLGLGILNWRHAGNQGTLFCILLVLSMKGIALMDAFRVGAICWGSSYVIQVVTQLLNLRPRDFVIHSKLGFRHIIRWGLGYTHPNVLQIATLALIAYVFYCYQYKTAAQLRRGMIAGIALSLWVFLYSLSITGMMMTAAFFMLLGYLEWNRFCGRQRSRVENVALQMLFPACVLFSVLAPLLLQGRAFDLLNKVMTHRPELSRFFMTTYGLLPFGDAFTGLAQNYTMDCSYVNLLMNGGWILFVIMCAGYYLLIRQLLQAPASRENSIALAITFYTVIGAMSEPFAFNTSYKNVSLLFMGHCFYGATWQQESLLEQNSFFRRMHDRVKRCCSRIFAGTWRQHLTAVCAAIVIGILCSLGYGAHNEAPQDIYALRTHTDHVEEYAFLYYTPEEIETLRQQDDAWVLEYRDAASIMIRFSGEGIGETEEVRTEVTICLSVAIIAYIVVMAIKNRKKEILP